MYNGVREASLRILVVRLGAMGDIIHTLPAVASLKHSLPGSHITWAISPQWAPLLKGNVFVDRLILVERTSLAGLLRSRKELRREPFHLAVDFQGLIKSALVASVAGPDRIFGFSRSQVREKPAALFYSSYATPTSKHVVDRNLDLARRGRGVEPALCFPAAARRTGTAAAGQRFRAGLPAGRLGFEAMAGGILHASGQASRTGSGDGPGGERSAFERGRFGQDRRRLDAYLRTARADPRDQAREGRGGCGQRSAAPGRGAR